MKLNENGDGGQPCRTTFYGKAFGELTIHSHPRIAIHVPTPNLEDQETVFVRPLTIDQPGMRDSVSVARTPPSIAQWVAEVHKPPHHDKVQSLRDGGSDPRLLESVRLAVTPVRCLAAMPPEGSTRVGIIPGCPNLDRINLKSVINQRDKLQSPRVVGLLHVSAITEPWSTGGIQEAEVANQGLPLSFGGFLSPERYKHCGLEALIDHIKQKRISPTNWDLNPRCIAKNNAKVSDRTIGVDRTAFREKTYLPSLALSQIVKWRVARSYFASSLDHDIDEYKPQPSIDHNRCGRNGCPSNVKRSVTFARPGGTENAW
ncbi:hypothetical protein T265_08446 [Opisthorchis viverrini]|uniref:Uncharacterized protein n=1 Tax=Opisthorchis viverrini TaxID=6198 RepID=A0A074ZK45_OPIVI|nr:hypothetical protein T265_08446 [Opisthorchis viverrini]KER23720.1 hypothetical protein T265_08446 [Opisthorchis viverrini]